MSAGILTRSLLQRDQTLFLSFIQGSAGQRDSQIRWQKKVIKNIKSLKKISVWRLIFDIWHMINTENKEKTCISVSNTGFCCPKPSQDSQRYHKAGFRREACLFSVENIINISSNGTLSFPVWTNFIITCCLPAVKTWSHLGLQHFQTVCCPLPTLAHSATLWC